MKKIKCFVKGCNNKVVGYIIMKGAMFCKEHEKLVDEQPYLLSWKKNKKIFKC